MHSARCSTSRPSPTSYTSWPTASPACPAWPPSGGTVRPSSSPNTACISGSYLSSGRSTYSHPVKWLLLRFHRMLASAVYAEAALVAPGNVYNQRWEIWDGVPDSSIRTVYNGVDPDEFALADAEPAVPTISWAGRVDPIKDLETLVRAFAIVHEKMPEAKLRIFGGTPAGNEAYRDGLRGTHPRSSASTARRRSRAESRPSRMRTAPATSSRSQASRKGSPTPSSRR